MASLVRLLMMRRAFVPLAAVALLVGAVVLFVVSRDRTAAPKATESCFVLSFTPTPTSGGSFEASVGRRSGCEGPEELLGGLYLELRSDDRTVAYLETPDKVLPAGNADFKSAGVDVKRQQPFKLPKLNEGRYTLCSGFSTESNADQQACTTFEVS